MIALCNYYHYHYSPPQHTCSTHCSHITGHSSLILQCERRLSSTSDRGVSALH